jgi:tetratricopeptide (TPR) repeat protein
MRPASPSPVSPKAGGAPRLSRGAIAAGLAALAAGLVLFAAGATGYQSGVAYARQTQASGSASAAQEQFDLGVADLLAGNYELAVQRFEYVLQLDPVYPGVTELLEKARAGLNVPTSTPGPTATPITPTPTLDVSSLDTLFAQAQEAFVAQDWSRTLEALLAIRLRDPAYRRDESNGLIAQALRNRGVARILQGDIEQGIYDLSLALRFGSLDDTAVAWRNSGAFYLFANSFIGVDWLQAAANFESLCRADLWDSCSKYARAAYEYGHLLLSDSMPCEAADQYEISLRLRDNSPLEPTATHAARLCAALSATPTITLTPVPSLTPTIGVIPTDTETPTLPPAPTETETPSPTPSETATPG